jgi:hypothetical protein
VERDDPFAGHLSLKVQHQDQAVPTGAAEKSSRRLDGQNQPPKVIRNTKSNAGIEVDREEVQAIA